jgi:hypothetical protein
MTTFSNEETHCLNRVAIHHELAKLSPMDRAIITLHFRYAIPHDYIGLWPPRLADIGHYIGRKYRGRPLSAPFVHARVEHILYRWQCIHHHTATVDPITDIVPQPTLWRKAA